MKIEPRQTLFRYRNIDTNEIPDEVFEQDFDTPLFFDIEIEEALELLEE